MARPRSPAIAHRNELIYAEWRDEHRSLAWLAEKYQRTPQQIGRVLAAFHPDLEDEDDRALHRGRLEHLYGDVRGIFEAPGWKMSPTGKPAEGPDGEPAEDVMVKVEAAKLALAVLESMRKLDARDRQPKRDQRTPEDEARQAMLAALAAEKARMALAAADRLELEQYRRGGAHPPVIPGEVVREGRPGRRRGEGA